MSQSEVNDLELNGSNAKTKGNSNPPKDMNTSKSLDLNELLVPLFVQARQEALKELAREPLNRTAIITSTPSKVDHLVKEASAAIVEAVEGLIPYGYGDKVEGSGTAAANMRGFNECRDLVLQAIKEWQ